MSTMETLCTSRFDTPFGSLRIVTSEKGLVYIELPNENGRGFAGWKKSHARDARVLERRAAHDDVIDQLLEYASGNRRVFEMDLDVRGTEFQLVVYKCVRKIGYGKTVSYSDIANSVGKPKAVRAVGAANAANPIPLVIPCHRVIARGGALQGYAGGLQLKARLLAMESPDSLALEQERLF